MRILLPFSLLLPALLVGARLQAQTPPNDACANAIPIVCGDTIAGSTTMATPDLNAIECGTGVQAAGVWYRITGSDQAITLSTCSDFSYDTRLNVYSGACSGLQCVAGNDDGGDCDLGSTLTFAGDAGITYYILVQGYSGATGDFALTASCGAIGYDHCQGAQPISCNASLSGSTTGATVDAVPFCETGVQAAGVWYTFTGVEGQVQLSTCESVTFDSRMNVYSGTCNNLVCVTGNDDTENVGACSTVNFIAEPGLTYRVLVQGYDGAVGDFLLDMACPTCGTPTAVNVSASDSSAFINWNSLNTGATYEIEYGPLGFIQGTGTVATGAVSGTTPSARVDGLEAATEYAFYLREICGPEDQSAWVGVFTFTTLDGPPAVNSICSGALAIACGGSVEGDTGDSFFQPGEHCGAAYISAPGLWYAFSGDGGTMTLSTCGQASFDTRISVYSGTCNTLACVAGGDDAPGCESNSTEVTFQTTNGTSYFAFVHAYMAQTGTFTMSLTCNTGCAPVPANDQCSGAALINVAGLGLCSPSTANNTCAFASGVPNPPCDSYAPVVDVWYRFETGPFTSFIMQASALSASEVNAALYMDCGSLDYVDCRTEINGPWGLNNLETGSTYYIRLWNGGGAEAGTMALCLETDLTTALAEHVEEPTVRLWPNPANDHLTIAGNRAARIAVVDLQGRTVMTHATNNAPQVDLDITALAPGSYMVRSLDAATTLGRFIKE